MITKSDLPLLSGATIFDLDDDTSFNVQRKGNGSYYGQSDSFDFEGNATDMIAKLNSWGARVVGHE